jgi:murein DD-endopeptidase MepM/ murein hydrolase activator NlpD
MGVFSPIQDKRWLNYGLIAINTALVIALGLYLQRNFWPRSNEVTITAKKANSAQQAELALPASQQHNPSPQTDSTIQAQVGTHGSLSQIFHDNAIAAEDLHSIMQLQLASDYLRVIQPKQTLSIQIDSQHRVLHLEAPLAGGKKLVIEKQPSGFFARLQTPNYSTTLEYASATIRHTLSHAAYLAGISSALTTDLTSIFAQKIDFNKDIRPGDHFDFLYQAKYHEGIKVGNGPIMAAEFTNHNTTYRAFRYRLPNGQIHYYDESGKNVDRLFLKAALHYSRISSYFSYHRMDPIIHRMQPHLGVDYAAPTGTPIHSISDGKVAFIGKRGGYGNAIVMQYGPHIKSLYGHLSHFAKHLHRGDAVEQGKIIGYVGQTGWATGPHLHYGLYIDGVARDPLHYKLPSGSRLSHHLLLHFKANRSQLLAQLNLHHGAQLGSLDSA